MPDIQEMIGKEVEVVANGVVYHGTLIEVTDEEVTFKTSMQWVSLPTATVSSLKPV